MLRQIAFPQFGNPRNETKSWQVRINSIGKIIFACKSYHQSLTNRSFDLEFSQNELRYDAKLSVERKFNSVDDYFVNNISLNK